MQALLLAQKQDEREERRVNAPVLEVKSGWSKIVGDGLAFEKSVVFHYKSGPPLQGTKVRLRMQYATPPEDLAKRARTGLSLDFDREVPPHEKNYTEPWLPGQPGRQYVLRLDVNEPWDQLELESNDVAKFSLLASDGTELASDDVTIELRSAIRDFKRQHDKRHEIAMKTRMRQMNGLVQEN